MSVIGANTSQLRALSELFGGRAGQIAAARSVIDFRLRTIPWQGANANRFRSQWVALRRTLQQTETGLQEASRMLRAHAAEQDRASAASGLGTIALIPRISLDGGKRDATREELLNDYADRNAQVHREIRSALEELKRERDSLLAEQNRLGPPEGTGDYPSGVNLESERIAIDLARTNDQIRHLEGLLDPSTATKESRQYLVFDPTVGDQRLVEVVGDLSEADRVIIHIPGMNTDLGEYEEGGIQAATNLYLEANQLTDQNIVLISFMDYDVPQNLEAASRAGADSGVEPLQGLVAELHQMGFEAQQISVVAHSYGSRMAGAAMQSGLDVDRVIALGSPGMGANDRAGLGSESVEVWAARAANDPVGVVPHLYELPLSPVLIPHEAVAHWLQLSPHGADPSDPGFGANRFPVDGASGHSAYFEKNSQSLREISRLAIGTEAKKPS